MSNPIFLKLSPGDSGKTSPGAYLGWTGLKLFLFFLKKDPSISEGVISIC
jgi:hypothetical protein